MLKVEKIIIEFVGFMQQNKLVKYMTIRENFSFRNIFYLFVYKFLFLRTLFT